MTDLAAATPEWQICQLHRPTPSTQYGTVAQNDQAVIWWQIDFTGLLTSWKAQLFVLTSVGTYSGYVFAFSVHVSAKTIIYRHTEYLIYLHSLPHSIASDKGTHFTAKSVVVGSCS